MNSSPQSSAPAKVGLRQISEADTAEVVDLLTRGYRVHPREFWRDIFAGLSRRSVPDGFPRYGYVLESGGKPVGAILLIFSTVWIDGAATIRCNGSSLYVDPAFRIYAPLLLGRALKEKNVTVLNLTAAPHTHKMVEASGFARFSNGRFATVPVFSRAPKDAGIRVIGASQEPDAPFNPQDRQLLLEHADFGCTSLWCVANREAYPFVFQRRAGRRLPFAQLVYCRNVESFVRFARPIGLYLLRKLQPLVILDANGPIPGLFGKYFSNRPRFFLGPDRPHLGDLAYTETALFGI